MHDEANPSWVPTLKLGYERTKPTSTHDGSSKRFARVKRRRKKIKNDEAASALLLLSEKTPEDPKARGFMIVKRNYNNCFILFEVPVPVLVFM